MPPSGPEAHPPRTPQTRQLLTSTFIVIIFFGLGKLTGLGRTILVSNVFGTDAVFDAFTAANQLPEVFVTLISGGALAAALIPVYSAYLRDPQRHSDAARLAHSILTLVIIVLAIVSAIGAIIAPWLTSRLLVPHYTPELQALTASLMRIILFQTTLIGISGVLSSLLNARQHFALPALTTVALDIGYVLGLWWFVPSLGIRGLAWGSVLGALFHIGIQVPALIRYRINWRPILDWRMGGVREVIRLMGPRIVTLGAIQAADLVIINLASNLPPGSTSGYFYGYYLQQLPETLFGTAVALVVFPTLAELFNAGNIEGMKRLAVSSLRIIWVLTIPSAVGLALLGRAAITLVLERGAFDAASTRLVYTTLLYFTLRIVSEATLEIVARLFYAQHDTRTPMYAALVWLAIDVTLALILVRSLGIGGLALASSIAFTVQAALLFQLNRRRLGSLGEGALLRSLLRTLVATAGMAGAILLLQDRSGGGFVGLGLQVGVGIIVYGALSLMLGGRELTDLLRLVRGRSSPA